MVLPAIPHAHAPRARRLKARNLLTRSGEILLFVGTRWRFLSMGYITTRHLRKVSFGTCRPKSPDELRIYEAHAGMSSIEPKIQISTRVCRRRHPPMKRSWYNHQHIDGCTRTRILCNLFGYHVTNFSPSHLVVARHR